MPTEDTIRYLLNPGGDAQASAILSLGNDPQRAARAQQLADATGADPEIVFGDLDGWERQTKAGLASEIIGQNRYIQNYIDGTPLAASISGDDWGTLDKVSQSLNPLTDRSAFGAFVRHAERGVVPALASVPAMGYGAGIGQTLIPIPVVGGLIGAGVAGLGASYVAAKIQDWALAQLPQSFLRGLGLDTATAIADAEEHPLAAFLGGMAPYLATMKPTGASLGQRAIGGAMGAGFEAGQELATEGKISPRNIGVAAVAGGVFANPNVVGERLFNMGQRLSPWIAAGKVPPTGVDPVVDRYKILQAFTDAETLDNIRAAAKDSTTLERSPEAFAEFIRLHAGEKVGISADAIMEVSGGDPLNGPLGWVPNLQEQLDAALRHGGDVQVPIADFVAKVEPEVAQALRDHVRVRPEGLTVAEAQAIGEPTSSEVGPVQDQFTESVEAMRKAAGLEPKAIPEPEAKPTEPRIGWMPKDIFARYEKLIQKQHMEDVEAATARAERLAQKQHSDEWKTAATEFQKQVATELDASPEFVAETFFRDGELNNFKFDKHRLAADALTPEQIASLPPSFVSKSGIHPDDIAALLGFTSSNEMIQALAELNAARGGKNPSAFRRQLIQEEVERRLNERFGQPLLEEINAQVLSQTQMDLLHEQVRAAAAEAGAPFLHEDGRPVTPKSFQQAVSSMFEGMHHGDVSAERFLRDAGKAAKAIEEALVKGDPAEAFRQHQRQYIAAGLAREALKFEKEVAKFEKKVSSYQKGEVVRGVDQAHTNFVQRLLAEAGFKLKVTEDQLRRGSLFEAGGQTLDQFIADRASYGHDYEVSPGYKPKPVGEMTVAEYNEFMDAIMSLDHVGRAEQKVLVAGQEMDREQFREEVNGNLKQREALTPEQQRDGRWMWRLEAPITRAEEIIKDLDLRKELGPLFNSLIYPFAHAKAKSYEYMDRLSKDLRSLKDFGKAWRRSMGEDIAQDFMWDTNTETPYKLTRWNMLKMMLNSGNESNFQKLAEGIARAPLKEGEKATPAMVEAAKGKIWELFRANARKEDWDFVQKIWDIHEGWVEDTDKLTRSLSGGGPKFIPAREIDTPFGKYRGGYVKLVPDKTRPLQGHLMVEKEPADGAGPIKQGFYRATTNQTRLIDRTGAKYWVDLDTGPEQLIGQMQQTIHDLSFREFVVNAGKVLYDPKMTYMIDKHYGPEYRKALQQWVENIANVRNTDERSLQGWNGLAKRIGDNLIYAALPLNYRVIFSPSLGTANLAELARFNANHKANMAFVLARSEELKHVLYSLDRDVTVALSKALNAGQYSAFQRAAAEKMMKPLTWMEQQFRAVTWMGEYRKQMAAGRTDAQASILADSVVRERHSVGHIGDLSTLRASPNQFVRLSTLFMGYFEAQRNWARQMPGQIREGDFSGFARTLWGTVGIAAAYNYFLFTKQGKDESWGMHLAKSVAGVPLQMFPFVKDVYGYVAEGYNPSNPIVQAMISVADLGKDGWQWAHGKQPKKLVRHTVNAIGLLTGVPGAVQVGRTSQFLYDNWTRQQRPRDIYEWAHGVVTGEVRPKK